MWGPAWRWPSGAGGISGGRILPLYGCDDGFSTVVAVVEVVVAEAVVLVLAFGGSGTLFWK